MNTFFIKLGLRICYFTASALWGIMGFLQYKKYNETVKLHIYNSIEIFREEFSKLNECQKELDLLTLHYDNFAVFFGGLFLVLYALKQKIEIKNTKTKSFWPVVLTILLCFGIIYMALDWIENYCFYQANDPQFTFGSFKWVQLFKWIVGVFTLVALAFLDILLLRNWQGVLWGIFGFIFINGLVSKSFGLDKNATSICSKYSK